MDGEYESWLRLISGKWLNSFSTISTWTGALVHAVADLDRSLSAGLHQLNSGLLRRSFVVVSALGSERVFVPAGLIVAGWSLWGHDLVGGAVLAMVTLLTRRSIYALKALTPRSRPAAARLQSSSFPSGHTIAAVAVYGTAADVIRGFALGGPLSLLPLLLGAMIGLSRVALGFHWVTDAIVGFGIGLLIWSAASVALRYL